MWRLVSFGLSLGTALGLSLMCSVPSIANELDDKHWKMVFDCEFDSRSDLKKWNVVTRSENANNELQAYVANACTVHDGCLYIQAQKQDGTYKVDKHDKVLHYTSGLLDTKHRFAVKYGRFDIAFKVPAGKGLWPAFWLLPETGKWPPEIDWMEILGDKPNILYTTNHFGAHLDGKHPQHGPKVYEAQPDYSQEFHKLTGVWNENEITCYIDGKKTSVSHDGVPHEKMYMILNLAVGGDWPGAPDAETPFPSNMMVDYVRVYKHK